LTGLLQHHIRTVNAQLESKSSIKRMSQSTKLHNIDLLTQPSRYLCFSLIQRSARTSTLLIVSTWENHVNKRNINLVNPYWNNMY